MTQDNDPWGNNPRNTDTNELAAALNRLKQKLFNQQQGGGDNGDQNTPKQFGSSGLPNLPKKLILPAVIVGFVGWMATGVYILPEGSHGVELVFGKYRETAVQPGFNTRWPAPVGSVEMVDIGSIRNLTVGGNNTTEGQMLTADENIVEVSLSVQYKIAEAEKYLFNVNEPETVLRETMISSIREVVGGSTVDYVLTDGRAEWPALVQNGLVETLKGFDVGFDILRVKLREAKAPQQVQAAFDDAVKAREDAERYKLQAEAYQNKELPLARGAAKEIIAQAEAYKESVIAQATGEAQRFSDVLVSYQTAPQITRDRLYIETMQSVYQNVNNIVVATGDNAPMMYLPMGQGANTLPLPPVAAEQKSTQTVTPSYDYRRNLDTTTKPQTSPTTKRLTR